MVFLPKCITMICETDLHHFNLENFSRSNQLTTQQYCIRLILRHLFHAANENQPLKALSFPHWLPWNKFIKIGSTVFTSRSGWGILFCNTIAKVPTSIFHNLTLLSSAILQTTILDIASF